LGRRESRGVGDSYVAGNLSGAEPANGKGEIWEKERDSGKERTFVIFWIVTGPFFRGRQKKLRGHRKTSKKGNVVI